MTFYKTYLGIFISFESSIQLEVNGEAVAMRPSDMKKASGAVDLDLASLDQTSRQLKFLNCPLSDQTDALPDLASPLKVSLKRLTT